MPPVPARFLAALGGLAFVALFVAAVAAFASIGTEDGAAASAWGEALEERGGWAQRSGYLHGLAGLSLAAFAASFRAPAWGRGAGVAWGASFLLGGVLVYASADLAGHQAHAEGAKTALVLGHLLYANPIAALLGALFALGVGRDRSGALPSWFRRLSLFLGGLGALLTLVGGFFGLGLIGMAPLAAWLLVAAVVAPWCAWRGR